MINAHVKTQNRLKWPLTWPDFAKIADPRDQWPGDSVLSLGGSISHAIILLKLDPKPDFLNYGWLEKKTRLIFGLAELSR